ARRAQSIGRSPLPALGPVVRSVLRLPTSFAAVGLACFESHVFGPLLIGCAVDLNLGRQPMNVLCPRCVAAVEAGSYAARGPGGAAGPAPGPERRSRPRLAPGTCAGQPASAQHDGPLAREEHAPGAAPFHGIRQGFAFRGATGGDG